MAEIGLVKLAAVALRGGPAALPAQRRNFATRPVPQPQRLAIWG
jgi:hypothetical protein